MATLLETVQRFRKIEEATAAKDDPAPVYLLDEIADMARQSPESAQAIADAVQKKLSDSHKSPIVKFKALRIVKHLCTKGCSQFQRCMQRHSSSVRDLIHFRGDPDPFKGDVPNARVREFAKEVVEVLFNSTPVTNSSNTLAAQGKIQGFGSAGPESRSSSSNYGGIGSSNSGRYGGFSSSSLGNASSGLPGSLAAAQQAASQLTQAATQALGEGPIAQGIANAASALGGFLQPAGYGSRLNDNGYRDNSDSFGYSNASSYSAPAVSHVTPSQVLGSEEGLVDDITAPGGLRPLPDAADLRRFVDTASNMDGLRIAELLRAKMESARWQVVLRALAALEAVLQRGSTQACGEVAVMFQSDPTPVRSCLQSQQQQVQQRAAAVLKLLLGEEVALPVTAAAGSSSSTSKKPAAAAAPAMDLLIDDSPEPAASAAAAAPASGGIDLLGDLEEPAPLAPPAAAAAPAPAAAVDSLFDGLGVAATSSDDMFGGLSVAAPVPAAAAAAAAAAAPAAPAAAALPAATKQSAPLDELFSGLTTNSSPAAGSSSLLATAGFASGPGLVQQQGLQMQQQQMQVQGRPSGQSAPPQQDLLGDFDLGGPPKQPQGFGILQVNDMQQQQQQQQQQFSMPGLGMQQQQQQPWGGMQGGLGAPMAAGLAGLHPQQQQQQQGMWQGLPAHTNHSHSSGAGGNAWSGHDDVSNLMRQVGHGGKYDPAFDFVADEFKKR